MIKKLFKVIFNLIWVVWLLLLVLIGARFAQINSAEVSLDLLFIQTPAMSLGFMICLAFACGAVFGVAILGPMLFFYRRRTKKLKAKNQKLSKPVSAALLPATKS